MTKEREALKLAGEFIGDVNVGEWAGSAWRRKETLATINAALAQPEQEPVAVFDVGVNESIGAVRFLVHQGQPLKNGDKLYTAPPKREWVGLTDEEVELVYEDVSGQSLRTQDYRLVMQFAYAIEAKLKELNHG